MFLKPHSKPQLGLLSAKKKMRNIVRVSSERQVTCGLLFGLKAAVIAA
jgi:hypothetical protein